MNRYFTADIHGGLKSLLQCFERCKFDYNKDELIVGGDVCDGWPETKQVIDELMKIKNLIFILGNHDEFTLHWFLYNTLEPLWINQGGRATILSYGDDDSECVPKSHIDFLRNAPLCYIDDEKNDLFVHGGIDPEIEEMAIQRPNTLLWDRSLIEMAVWKHKEDPRFKFSKFNHIFVGHTTTFLFNEDKPIFACNIIDTDTGGGYEGKLTIMNRDTFEYWQSDRLNTLYPTHNGRRIR